MIISADVFSLTTSFGFSFLTSFSTGFVRAIISGRVLDSVIINLPLSSTNPFSTGSMATPPIALATFFASKKTTYSVVASTPSLYIASEVTRNTPGTLPCGSKVTVALSSSKNAPFTLTSTLNFSIPSGRTKPFSTYNADA